MTTGKSLIGHQTLGRPIEDCVWMIVCQHTGPHLTKALIARANQQCSFMHVTTRRKHVSTPLQKKKKKNQRPTASSHLHIVEHKIS